MDFDLDGVTDIISGSYDPGDIYLFRGLGKGEYAGGESILDQAGVPLVHHPVEMARYQAWEKRRDAARDREPDDQAGKDGEATGNKAGEVAPPTGEQDYDADKQIRDRVASFGSWPEPVDWDNDGDLDLLIGSFQGTLWLRTNVGTRARPVFSPMAIQVEADGQPLKVSGHADPVAADWDRDGLWDLVVGSSVGQVGWYRNEGSPGSPRFGPFRELIPAVAENKFFEQELAPDQVPVPGVRKQICVADYNGDGWPDLLVGDFSELKLTRELSAEQLESRERDRKPIAALDEQIGALGYEGEEGEKRQKLVTEVYELIDQFNKEYYRKVYNGSFVWLYLRRPDTDGNDSPARPPMSQAGTGQEATGGAPSGPAGRADVRPAVEDLLTFDAPAAGPEQVRFAARIVRDDRDPALFRLDVRSAVSRGWHLYAPADPSGGSPEPGKRPTRVTVQLPDGLVAEGEMIVPAGEPDRRTPRVRVIAGRAAWQLYFRQAGDGIPESPVVVTVDFQVCNELQCLPPDRQTLTVVIPR